MYRIIVFLLIKIFITSTCNAQQLENWSANEQRFYKTLTAFCTYITTTKQFSRDTIFNRYFLFNTYNNIPVSEYNQRVIAFDSLVLRLKYFIDSTGINNLDAMPLRFFATDKKTMLPFTGELKQDEPRVFVYFIKTNMTKPLGYLLFDNASGKIISWLLIQQSSRYYFFTFDLI